MKRILLLGLLAIRVAAQPVITNQPANQLVVSGANATFSVMVTGVGPFTYQWQFNGTNLPVTNIITTVAGTNAGGFSGDGGAATNARLLNPYGVAIDAYGNIFIADKSNNRIRRVDTNGIIMTVAGTNVGGFNGDGGAATNTRLNSPYGIAVDSFGNLFIADSGNNRIRKVDTNGIIMTVAGTNSLGFSGDGGSATNAKLYSPFDIALDTSGNLFIADTSNNRIRKVDTNGVIMTVAGTNVNGFAGDGGAATNAKLNSPYGIALDATGNLFIADTFNSRIRRVNTNGFINTVAGTNSGGFSGDGGAATNAKLNLPYRILPDAYGNLLIADTSNNRIRKVDTNGNIITVVGTNSLGGFSGDGGAATNAQLSSPCGMAFDAFGNLIFADQMNNRIRKVGLTGSPLLVLPFVATNKSGSYDVIITSPSGSVTSSVVNLNIVWSQPPFNVTGTNGSPISLAVIAYGGLQPEYQWYFNNTILDGATDTTLTFTNPTPDETGNYFCVVSNNYGSVTGSVFTLSVVVPPSITLQPTNQIIVVSNKTIFTVAVTGTGPFAYQWQCNGTNLPVNNIITTVAGITGPGYSGDGGKATIAQLSSPDGVTVDSWGNFFIADFGVSRIRMVNTNGIINTIAGIGTSGYSGDGSAATNAALTKSTGVAVDSYGNVFFADYGNYCIRKVDTNGAITTVAGNGTSGFSGDGGAATNAKIGNVYAIAVDISGNLYISDTWNNRVRKVDANGIISTVAGNGSSRFSGDGGQATNAALWFPWGVGADRLGNLFIADYDNNRIRKVSLDGIITTVAGGGTGGDGGAATNAGLSSPNGVAVDPYGDLFISQGSLVRKVDVNGILSTVAGRYMTGFSGDGGPATNATLNTVQGIAVDSTGNLFIADVENSRIREVNLAGSPTLTLSRTFAKNAGSYSVIITSPYGSVTSSNAVLTVLVPPNISAWLSSDGTCSMSWTAQSNYTYQLQFTTNLVTPIWQNLGSPIVATNNTVSTSDNSGTDEQRFYRVLLTQ